ncbi:hypothetical protein [Streptomyces sp. B21-101]|uniref:hypothetical protein n=1 Tax=Streptomyces sp. B21-101 TaxID=3039415 RepID=UPI002FF03F4C
MAGTLIGLDETTRQDVVAAADPPWTPRARGRHRRPRPRKVLFAAGGLALAAGMLSLLRPTPDTGGAGALGTAEAEPPPDLVTSADDDAGVEAGDGDAKASDDGRGDRAADDGRPSAAGAAAVTPAPTAPTAMGGASAGPAREAGGLLPGAPGAATSVALTPGATYVPAPRAATPAPTATATPAPPSAPRPTPITATPAPQPPKAAEPGQRGLCVPIIGLCVDPLSAPAPQR